MTIRTASIKDIPAIRQIVDATWPNTYGAFLSPEQIDYMITKFYSDELLSEQISHTDHTFFLAEENGIAYGFAAIQLNYPVPGTTKLHKIYVLPSAQGKNIGRQLLDLIKNVAETERQQFVLLNVNRYNQARQFYERSGFEVIQEEDIEIGNGYLMEDFVMRFENIND